MLSDFIKVIDRKQWARDEMIRLVDEGVLEVPRSLRVKRRPKKKKPTQQKAVYLMRAGVSYKIGFAGDPAQRRKDIQVGCPVPVVVVHSVRTDYYQRLERKLHSAFARHRTGGEWFTLDDKSAQAVIEMMTAYVYTEPEPNHRLSAALAVCGVSQGTP